MVTEAKERVNVMAKAKEKGKEEPITLKMADRTGMMEGEEQSLIGRRGLLIQISV